MRRLFVCCDGTWNDANNEDDNDPAPTNVRRMFEEVAGKGAGDIPQLATYIEGVGSSIFLRLSGGALGAGISADIRQGYRWLCKTYQPGDEVFLIGFSRGAFTARSLAGFIGKCGLIPMSSGAFGSIRRRIQALQAFEVYRDKNNDGVQWRAENKHLQT